MGTILSFLGGTAFRWLIGELFGWLKARDEHKQEMERMRLQREVEKDRHAQQQEAIAANAAAGIKVIEAKREADAGAADDAAFIAAISNIGKAIDRPDWVGTWNAAVNPLLATVCIILVAANSFVPAQVTLTPILIELIAAVLGVFVGKRIPTRW